MDNLLGLNSQKFIPETTALFNGGNSFAPLAGTDGEIAAFFRQPSGYKSVSYTHLDVYKRQV